MRDFSILDRQLHTFKIEEVKELRRVADTVFEPLMRPFRQKRAVNEFSFSKSIRTAQRIGYLMPTYERIERQHRKSRLIIAMSLAGIDRCSAVSLIPLLFTLKESSLDFKFYVYTDDLILAEFTHDGFLANDHLIAWNHVSGPAVMTRLSELETDSQEDTLLIIDSLGGGQSQWFEYWTYEHRDDVRCEQQKYLTNAGKYSCYSKLRQILSGDYSKIRDIKKLPEEWVSKVESNCRQRWMETPALEEYMIRWVFNPKFGENSHGDFFIPHQSAFNIMTKLRSKFRQIHLLTPNNQGHHRNTLDAILRTNVIDYHHQSNTIYGFATVLSNIVHGQCPFDGPFTKKVSYEIIKFSEYTGDFENEDGVFTDKGTNLNKGDHTELVSKGKCFDNCPEIIPNLPEKTTLNLEKRPRGSSQIQIYELPYNEIDLSELLPANFDNVPFWKEKILSEDFEIDRGDSEYTRLLKAEGVLETIQNYYIVYKKGYGHFGLVRERRPVVSDAKCIQEILSGIEYEKHHTRSLREDVEEVLMMMAPDYHSFMHQLSIKHVVWCNQSMYAQENRAISVNPSERVERKRELVFHECGHYVESCCPPLGAFTNELLKQKCGQLNKKKLVQVGGGEFAMPVINGTADWISSYAGKWYKRKHPNLPNNTEIFSVYLEYFTSKEKLVRLIKHDPNMVRFIAFCIMGGPIAAFSSIQELKRKQALYEINQRGRKSSGYVYTFKRGKGRRTGGSKKLQNKGFGL